jgi:tetratricopeptide (TPR) repeat protein
MSRLAEEGFARAALQSGCSFSAGLAEARALMVTGRPEEAERILASVRPPTDNARVTLSLLRARNLFWALDRPGGAETVLDEGEEALAASGITGGFTTASGIAELHALRARFAFAQGHPRAALAMAAPVEADERAPEAARVRAAEAMAEALAVCGRRDEAVRVARRWEPAAQRQLAGAQALAHWLAGSLAEATFEAERAYAAAADPQGWAVAALLLGHVWLSRGDTDAALRWFRESSVLLRGSDPVGMRPAALAGIAQAAARAGDEAHARAVIAELDRMPHAAGRGIGEELGLARAWTARVSGDHARAIAIAAEVVATAEARGADGFATRARAELTRLNHPRRS